VEASFTDLVHEALPEDNGIEEPITLAHSGMTFGVGMGLSIKLGRTFTFNLFEVKGVYYNEAFNFYKAEPLYQFQLESGVTFRLFRQK
jgi:hypothetical protein